MPAHGFDASRASPLVEPVSAGAAAAQKATLKSPSEEAE